MALPRGMFVLFPNVDPLARRQASGDESSLDRGFATMLDTNIEQWMRAALRTCAMLPYNVLGLVFDFVPREFWFVNRGFHAVAQTNFRQMSIQQKSVLFQRTRERACRKIMKLIRIREENEAQLQRLYRTCSHPRKKSWKEVHHCGRTYHDECPDCGWRHQTFVDRHP